MDIVYWLIFGLIAGVIAKFLMPGPEASSWIMTILLGIAGSMVGGYLGKTFLHIGGSDFIGSLLLAVLGACVLLAGYRLITGQQVT